MTNNINPLMDGNPSSLSEPGARGQEDLRRGVMARFRLRHALRRRPTRPRGARTIPKTGVTANAATARARRPQATPGYRGRRYPGSAPMRTGIELSSWGERHVGEESDGKCR